MIGWSSRNTRDRKRRARWWASLTDEERALERRRSAAEDRWFGYTFGATFVLFVLLWWVVPHELINNNPYARLGVLVALPVSLVVGSFVAIYKRRQVK